jgi:hypothetical protein
MKTKQNSLNKISLRSGFAVAFAVAAWFSGAARAADHGADHGKGVQPLTHMNHIKTQAQAEALKPGDSMSMTCTKCKSVMVQKVTADKAHVKMMTVGEKVKCSCGGTVEVVATGKGKGKDAEVKHVCSKCGDDAMFCSAVKPGTGSFYEKQKELQSR